MTEMEESAAELKRKERHKRMEMSLEKYSYGIGKTTEHSRILSFLDEVKLKIHVGLVMEHRLLPEKFRCPASPASGQYYDWSHIQKWLESLRLACPFAQEKIRHSIFAPKCLIRSLILHWCEERDNDLAMWKSYQDIDGQTTTITKFNENYFNSLLGMMSGSDSDQKEAAKELRRITLTTPSYRADFRKFPDAISRLLGPLSESKIESDPDLNEDLITTLLNLSRHGDNKKLIADHPLVIPLLIHSMKFGTIETIRKAAAALFELSLVHSNKFIIGNSEAPQTLLNLLREGPPLAMKMVALGIIMLCTVSENKAKFTEIGAVNLIVQKIEDGILVNKLSDLLALLSTHGDAIEQLADFDMLRRLLKMIRDSSSDRAKENCAAILFNVCSRDPLSVKVIEAELHTLAELADTGTPRARKKASKIIAQIS